MTITLDLETFEAALDSVCDIAHEFNADTVDPILAALLPGMSPERRDDFWHDYLDAYDELGALARRTVDAGVLYEAPSSIALQDQAVDDDQAAKTELARIGLASSEGTVNRRDRLGRAS